MTTATNRNGAASDDERCHRAMTGLCDSLGDPTLFARVCTCMRVPNLCLASWCAGDAGAPLWHWAGTLNCDEFAPKTASLSSSGHWVHKYSIAKRALETQEKRCVWGGLGVVIVEKKKATQARVCGFVYGLIWGGYDP